MEVNLAVEKYKNGDRSPEVTKVIEEIIHDAYEVLEDENFHTAIKVIEKLTGIEYI